MNDIIETPLPAAEECEAQAALENAAKQNGKLSERFAEQLSATRTNLDRLKRVAADNPELFECADIMQVTPAVARVYIHASLNRGRNWKAFAKKYSANWVRDGSASDCSYWDYDGKFDGIEITILQAEKRPETEPL